MQYHLNGFRPGDPELLPAVRGPQGPLPEEVDVLIVGSGPAGLTLAAQLSAFPSITTRLVERKTGPMDKGQADGISCRSMEMFNAFGFAETVLKQGYWVNETTFWKPDPANPAHIARNGRVQDVEDGLSEMPHMILNQARVHDMYLNIMAKSPSRLAPDYGLEFESLTIGEGSHPVSVTLKEEGGGTRQVKAKYVVGCDGARSGVRKAIGRELVGDSANKAWGVMDVLAVTDFPDIRAKSLIQSANEGSVLIIPREGGYLVRIYIEMEKLKAGERVASRNIGVDQLIAAAQRVFTPYSFEVKDVVWWSVYEIGQRLTDKFDDVPAGEESTRLPHVFIAGDACHTHSPKAGQGMNVSMGDTFNLGWKLAAVLEGRATPELLHSYSAERQAVAQDLIDFDREWARIMSTPPEEKAGEPPVFQKYFIEHGRYTAGMSVVYKPSLLTGTPEHQALAQGFPIGARFHSAPVVRLADVKQMELGSTVLADGRWRLFAFAPQGEAGKGAISALCDYLYQDPNSPILSRHQEGAALDAVLDLRVIFQEGSRDLSVEQMPEALFPLKGRFALKDYEKVFCAKAGADIFELRGIDRAKGALVLVRPDQYVSHVLPIDGYQALTEFLAQSIL